MLTKDSKREMGRNSISPNNLGMSSCEAATVNSTSIWRYLLCCEVRASPCRITEWYSIEGVNLYIKYREHERVLDERPTCNNGVGTMVQLSSGIFVHQKAIYPPPRRCPKYHTLCAKLCGFSVILVVSCVELKVCNHEYTVTHLSLAST